MFKSNGKHFPKINQIYEEKNLYKMIFQIF